MSEIICEICPHHCHIEEGKTGLCKARANESGNNVCRNYGKLTSLAIDPIEKKPLAGFYPGSYILSAGSFGCNLLCPFCQNHEISRHDDVRTVEFMPEDLLDIAKDHPESIGIAFTYNEPLISYEYVLETAKLFRKNNLRTVLVTNGCVNMPVIEKLIPYIDAMNIDLKGDEVFYQELGGDYETVKKTIAFCADRTHVEITTLVVPTKNDSEEFIAKEAEWLASLDETIILHLSRYFPRYRYTIPPTEKETLCRLRDTASQYLKNVRLGNVW